MISKSPDWLRQARNKWDNTGRARPEFAIEPEPGQESVWDYPRPPALVADTRRIEVGEPGSLLASTRGAFRVLETASPPTVYLPRGDVDMARLVVAPGSSMCEWKGAARYWALAEQPDLVVAWDYPRPFDEFAALLDHLCFYPGRVSCRIDGEAVRSQPGGFYGGWVTDEIVGPWKGEPGTGSW